MEIYSIYKAHNEGEFMVLSVLWLILVIIFIIVEISTAALISIWFILGAVITMLLSLISDNIILQIAVFLIVSLISLILLRPFALKFAKPRAKSNVEAIFGKKGIVYETIENTLNQGRIKIMGQDWAALSENNQVIDTGKKVIVVNVAGNKLIVKEVEK